MIAKAFFSTHTHMEDYALLLVGMSAASLMMIVMSFATFRTVGDARLPTYSALPEYAQLPQRQWQPVAEPSDSPYAYAQAMQRG